MCMQHGMHEIGAAGSHSPISGPPRSTRHASVWLCQTPHKHSLASHCSERVRSGRFRYSLVNKTPPPLLVDLFSLTIAANVPCACFAPSAPWHAETQPPGVWGQTWACFVRHACCRCPGPAAGCVWAFYGALCNKIEKITTISITVRLTCENQHVPPREYQTFWYPRTAGVLGFRSMYNFLVFRGGTRGCPSRGPWRWCWLVGMVKDQWQRDRHQAAWVCFDQGRLAELRRLASMED